MASKSKALAIQTMCRECIYDDACPGTWRQQVAACTMYDCPLWPVRPMPTTAGAAWPESISEMLTLTTGLSREQIDRWRADPLEPPV